MHGGWKPPLQKTDNFLFQMASPLPRGIITNILDLRRSGISIREIARRLGVHRETVGKYLGRLEGQII